MCLLLLLASCAARVKNQVIRDANEGRCEQAIAVFEKNAMPEKVWQKTKQIGGATASGVATGVVAVTETTIYMLPGIAVGIVVCAPIIALEVAAKGRGDASAHCIVYFGASSIDAFANKSEEWVANKIWENTQTWRLEFYDDLSRMLRSTAGCYAGRNTPEAFATAEKQLQSIRESLWDKISEEEKRQVNLLLSDLEARKVSVAEQQTNH